VADWVTISALATAGGTLVLAGATFASVRSANRAARVAEQSMLAGLRPLLMPSRMTDEQQKIGFVDRWFLVPGGGGIAEVTDEAVYLAFGVRNAGSGIAVLHGWYLYPEKMEMMGTAAAMRAPLDQFHMLTRDLYIPPNDIGFWQGALREPSSPDFVAARNAIDARERLVIDVLYGDHEGGQRVITRFSMTAREDEGWMVSAARHWNIDRADPR
jgi:hypothetical protein